MPRHQIMLPGELVHVNAVRRSLLADLRALAPSTVLIHENTSCATDEYIAQRIAMIPFDQTLRDGAIDACTLTLDVQGRDALSGDLTGQPSPISPNIRIVHLSPTQRLQIEVSFEVSYGSIHACFMRTAAVGMQPGPGSGECTLTFDTVHGEDGRECVLEAIHAVRRRLEKVKRDLTCSV